MDVRRRYIVHAMSYVATLQSSYSGDLGVRWNLIKQFTNS